MNTLLAALKAGNVPGVHLGVNGSNIGAIAFYRKLGFAELEKKQWGLVLGRAIH